MEILIFFQESRVQPPPPPPLKGSCCRGFNLLAEQKPFRCLLKYFVLYFSQHFSLFTFSYNPLLSSLCIETLIILKRHRIQFIPCTYSLFLFVPYGYKWFIDQASSFVMFSSYNMNAKILLRNKMIQIETISKYVIWFS